MAKNLMMLLRRGESYPDLIRTPLSRSLSSAPKGEDQSRVPIKQLPRSSRIWLRMERVIPQLPVKPILKNQGYRKRRKATKTP